MARPHRHRHKSKMFGGAPVRFAGGRERMWWFLYAHLAPWVGPNPVPAPAPGGPQHGNGQKSKLFGSAPLRLPVSSELMSCISDSSSSKSNT